MYCDVIDDVSIEKYSVVLNVYISIKILNMKDKLHHFRPMISSNSSRTNNIMIPNLWF